jgi:hypothetical protein
VDLGGLLQAIKESDLDYERRFGLVLEAMVIAMKHGYKVGFTSDPIELDWPVAFIELPQGQLSWHLPRHERDWDGHTTAEKFARIDAFLAAWPAQPDYEQGERRYMVSAFDYSKALPFFLDDEECEEDL